MSRSKNQCGKCKVGLPSLATIAQSLDKAAELRGHDRAFEDLGRLQAAAQIAAAHLRGTCFGCWDDAQRLLERRRCKC